MASDSMKLTLGTWSLDELSAKNTKVDVTLTKQGLKLVASIDRLQLSEPIGLLKNIRLQCHELVFLSEQIICKKGALSFKHKKLGSQKITFSIDAQPDKKRYHFMISGLKLAESEMTINAELDQDKWQISTQNAVFSSSKLLTVISPYLSDKQRLMLAKWSIDSEMNVSFDIAGYEGHISSLFVNLHLSELNLSDELGQYVTEDIKSHIIIRASQKNDENKKWEWQIALNAEQGQAYAEPIFMDISATPLSLNLAGIWHQAGERLTIEEIVFEQQSVLKLHGKIELNKEGIQSADVSLNKSDIAQLYSVWLQPFVVGTTLDNLELSGAVSASIQQDKKGYQVSINLEDTFIHEQSGLFSFDGLSGQLAWTDRNQDVLTDIHWQAGRIYAIPIGQSYIKAQIHASTLTLLEPWNLPLLDGELQLNNFQYHHAADNNSTWEFDAKLTPLSMESLSAVLDWPLLHGQLSGEIPHVTYANQQIKIEGALKVNLFEGTTIIRDLVLDKPFGLLPQLHANISLKQLNLETLTQTFDFGKITGKLAGKISNLRLSNWKPVQFDAVFSTPEDDNSRHRISQKAVNNLSRVGGGAAGVLQRSFLRFFEDFSYKKLGLSCRLHNDVCDMSGVAEAAEGYYVVKGGGFPPQINVVGYTRRVSWSDLIERLKAVRQSSGPVIQ